MEKSTWMAIGLSVLLLLAIFGGLVMYQNAQDDVKAAVVENENLQKDFDAEKIKTSALNKELEDTSVEVETLKTEKQELEVELISTSSALADLTDKVDQLSETVAGYETEKAIVEEEEELVEQSEELDGLTFGQSIVFSLDDTELDKLVDADIEFDGEDYDVHEEFYSTADLMLFANGLGYDIEFGGLPYIGTTDEGALVYKYVFDDVIDMTDIDDNEPLEIEFLGMPMKIIKADADELVVESGKLLNLEVGTPIEYEGKMLELIAVDSEDNEALIKYGDDMDTIKEDSTETVGGLDVKVLDVFAPHSNALAGFAEVVVGTDAEETLENDEEFMDMEDFMFYIVSSGDDLEELVLVYDVKSDELDDEYTPLSVGEAIVFPYNYLTVEFYEVTDVDYFTYEFSFDEKDAEDNLSVDSYAIVVESDDKEGIRIDGELVDELYIMENGDMYYYDDKDFTFGGTVAYLENDDYKAEVTLGGAGRVRIVEESGNLILIDTQIGNQRIGALEEDAETDDVKYGSIGFGSEDEDVLTEDGLIILDVENNADNDEFSIMVPSEVVEATVLVY